MLEAIKKNKNFISGQMKFYGENWLIGDKSITPNFDRIFKDLLGSQKLKIVGTLHEE